MADDQAYYKPAFGNENGLVPARDRRMDLLCSLFRRNDPKGLGGVLQQPGLYKAGFDCCYRDTTT